MNTARKPTPRSRNRSFPNSCPFLFTSAFPKGILWLTSNTRDWFHPLGPHSDEIIHYEHDVCVTHLYSSSAMANSFSLVPSIPLYELITWTHVFLKSSCLHFTLLPTLLPLSTAHPALLLPCGWYKKTEELGEGSGATNKQEQNSFFFFLSHDTKHIKVRNVRLLRR